MFEQADTTVTRSKAIISDLMRCCAIAISRSAIYTTGSSVVTTSRSDASTPRHSRGDTTFVAQFLVGMLVVATAAGIVDSRVATAQESMVKDESAVQTFSGIDASSDTVYFNLHDGEIVSADMPWDLAFKGTSILTNGEAQVADVAFKKLKTAPTDGYKADQPGVPALPTANNEGWFDYDASSHQVTPVPFRTLAFKLASGGFAKLEVVDYYAADGTPRSYTIRYQLSADGEF